MYACAGCEVQHENDEVYVCCEIMGIVICICKAVNILII